MSMAAGRIDAHQHFWRIGQPGHEWPGPESPAIFRDFLPADLDTAWAGTGITSSILVQAQPDDRETDWLLALASETPSIAAIVGWADFRSPEAPARIAELATHPKLRGLRPMLQGLAPDWILDPACDAALRATVRHGLTFDALVRPQHLGAIRTLAERYPDMAIVIDHAAKPNIANRAYEPWATAIADLAALSNIACKLSGMVTEAAQNWTADDLTFYVRHILDCFGPERLIWGSDWPVVLLASSYDGWIEACQQLLAGLEPSDRDAIFGGNARRIYRID